MILFLRALFLAVLAAILWVTVTASLDRGVFTAAAELWPDPWFRATLADAYFGFLAVYVWIAWKERSWLARGLWFVALMTLGNLAIAVYFLRELFRLRPGDALEKLFIRRLYPETSEAASRCRLLLEDHTLWVDIQQGWHRLLFSCAM